MRKTYSLEKFKVKTDLFKHKSIYRVYVNIINHGVGSRKLYEGTYTECKKYLKTIKEQ